MLTHLMIAMRMIMITALTKMTMVRPLLLLTVVDVVVVVDVVSPVTCCCCCCCCCGCYCCCCCNFSNFLLKKPCWKVPNLQNNICIENGAFPKISFFLLGPPVSKPCQQCEPCQQCQQCKQCIESAVLPQSLFVFCCCCPSFSAGSTEAAAAGYNSPFHLGFLAADLFGLLIMMMMLMMMWWCDDDRGSLPLPIRDS